jgi:hypothetical protein
MTTDPLLKKAGTAQLELFKQYAQASDGFPTEAVVGAAANVIINAIRQTHQTRAQAEVRFDELFGQMKAILLDHYDSLGRKKGIFPYTQTIQGELFVPKDEFGKH